MPKTNTIIPQIFDESTLVSNRSDLDQWHRKIERLTRLTRDFFGVPLAWIGTSDPFGTEPGLNIVNDATADKHLSSHPMVAGPPHIRFYASCRVPGLKRDTCIHLCIADTKPRNFGDGDIERLTDWVAVAAADLWAIEHTILDQETNLPNRLGLMWFGDFLLPLGVRLSFPIVLLAINFPQLSEQFSKENDAKEDRYIQDIANILTRTFRDADFTARFNQDCFGVLLTNCTPVKSLGAAHRLGEVVDQFNAKAENDLRINFHLEVVNFEADRHKSMLALISDAEARLCEIKNHYAENGTKISNHWLTSAG